MITKDNIVITGIDSITAICEIKIKAEPDQHAKAKLDLLLEEPFLYSPFQEQTVCIEYESGGQTSTIFRGLVNDYAQKIEGNLYALKLTLISGSIKLDQKKRIQTFQNINQTYKDVVKNVLHQHPKGEVIFAVDDRDECPIHESIIQYEETDWEFCKRIASHLNSVVIPDTVTGEPKLYIGIVRRSGEIAEEFTDYIVSLDERYQNRKKNMQKDGCLFFTVKSRQFYQIGEMIQISKRRLQVLSLRAELKDQEMIFTYELGMPTLYYKEKQYNQLLIGAALIGTVIETEGNGVRVAFEVNPQEQGIVKVYPWQPIMGNVFYCMPEKGEKVAVIFKNQNEACGIATEYVRNNDISQCPGSISPLSRCFVTDREKELKLASEAMYLGNQRGDFLTLGDDQGTMIEGKKISIEVKGEIYLTAEGINAYAPLQSTFLKGRQGGASINICQDFNLSGPVTFDAKASPYTEEGPSRVKRPIGIEKAGKLALGMIPTGRPSDKAIGQALGMLVTGKE